MINLIIFYRRMRKTSVPNFIQKAWEMMSQPQNQHIIRWRPNGQSFQIINQPLFASQLLPYYFKHSNFSSFIRQLNMYNFHKRKTSDGVEFYHQLFRKDQKQLLIGIRRKPSEAEILQGQELIRRLAPECVKENKPVKEEEDVFIQEVDHPPSLEERNPFQQLHLQQFELAGCQKSNNIGFGLMQGMKGCEFNRWSMGKKVKTTIIQIGGDLQNRGY